MDWSLGETSLDAREHRLINKVMAFSFLYVILLDYDGWWGI